MANASCCFSRAGSALDLGHVIVRPAQPAVQPCRSFLEAWAWSLTLVGPDASMGSTAYGEPGGREMLKFAVRRTWSVPLPGLVIVLAGCKSGSGGGGY